jgi:hypothetical protein
MDPPLPRPGWGRRLVLPLSAIALLAGVGAVASLRAWREERKPVAAPLARSPAAPEALVEPAPSPPMTSASEPSPHPVAVPTAPAPALRPALAPASPLSEEPGAGSPR